MHSVNWWALLLRGIVAVLFGVFAFAWPGVTLLSLIFVFGAYALVDGVFAIVAGVRSPAGSGMWWIMLLLGVVGVIAGILAFVWPGATAFSLLVLMASWAIITGILEIVAAIQLRKVVTGEWLMVLGGLASIVIGALILMNPAAGALAVVWIIGSYAIFYGLLFIVLGIKLRSHLHGHHGAAPHPA